MKLDTTSSWVWPCWPAPPGSPRCAPNTGAAIVVFPGGGYNVLAIDLEGTEVCEWLTSRGITCVL